jgi:hypothetical protein
MMPPDEARRHSISRNAVVCRRTGIHLPTMRQLLHRRTGVCLGFARRTHATGRVSQTLATGSCSQILPNGRWQTQPEGKSNRVGQLRLHLSDRAKARIGRWAECRPPETRMQHLSRPPVAVQDLALLARKSKQQRGLATREQRLLWDEPGTEVHGRRNSPSSRCNGLARAPTDVGRLTPKVAHRTACGLAIRHMCRSNDGRPPVTSSNPFPSGRFVHSSYLETDR